MASFSDLSPLERDDLPLHDALRDAGAEVATPDWEDASEDWSRFDAVLLRTTWNYMDRRQRFLDWCAHVTEVSRLFNPLPVIRWNTLKTYLRDLEGAGLPIAPTRWLEPGETPDLAALLQDTGWSQGFLKPWIGAGARETLPFAMDAEGIAKAQAHADRLLPTEGLMLQPFLESVQTEGEYSVIYFSGTLSHVVRKIPVPGDYRVMDDFGARDEPVTLPPSDLAAAERALRTSEEILGCAEPLLYARIDFLRDGKGELVVNEVELVEPSLFFRHAPAAADRCAAALLDRL